MKLAMFLALVPMSSLGMDRLSALAWIESGNNDHAVGRVGEISRYQIRKSEWRKVTRSTRYTNPYIARTVAVRLLEMRQCAFRKIYNRPPTDFEFYALWNAPNQILRGYISSRVAQRCRRFANLCDLDEQPAEANRVAESTGPPSS
ncbi:MAG: hypothetical protein M1608_07510 [Candidatus Omnitrophica bacterium]|nr:hypothetical protein [Candidatus Omnitrophota bacterium]